MNEPELIAQTLKRGNYFVNIPAGAILAMGFALVAFSLPENDTQTYWPVVFVVVGAFVLAWLYWAIAITRWKLWAYARVNNINELKRQAIETKLIWPDDSFFSKLSIETAANKQKLKQLEEQALIRLSIKKADDASITDALLVYYSKGEVWLLLLFGAFIPFFTAYLWFDDSEVDSWELVVVKYIGVFLGALVFYVGYIRYKRIKHPLFVINDKGITIDHQDTKLFAGWDIVKEVTVVVKHQLGQDPTTYLVVYLHTQKLEFLVEFNVPTHRIIHYASVYKTRYKLNNP